MVFQMRMTLKAQQKGLGRKRNGILWMSIHHILLKMKVKVASYSSDEYSSFPKRILTRQERCKFCFENPNRPRHLVVAIANFTFLSLQHWQSVHSVVPGHCCILTLQVSSTQYAYHFTSNVAETNWACIGLWNLSSQSQDVYYQLFVCSHIMAIKPDPFIKQYISVKILLIPIDAEEPKNPYLNLKVLTRHALIIVGTMFNCVREKIEDWLLLK